MMQRFAGKRVAIYARYSTALQSDASVDDQIRVCSDFVLREGGTVDQSLIFTDRAESGASTDRAGFQAMLARLRERGRPIEVIVAEDLSRISRDSADTQVLLRDLRYREVGLVSAADGIDATDDRHRASAMLKGYMNEEALTELRYRTLRGLEGRARAGYSTGGALYGYRTREVTAPNGQVLGHEIFVFQPEADIVRRMFDLYLNGYSCARIAKLLNEEGVPSPRARTKYRYRGWVASTIREMLMNRAYTGEWSFKKKRWVKEPGTKKRRYRTRAQHEVLVQQFPQRRIIDQGTWNKVAARRSSVHAHFAGKGKANGAVMGRRTQYLLSGLLHCADCNAPMSIAGGSTQRYYMCNDNRKRGTCGNCLSLREDVVRERILAGVRQMFLDPGRLAVLHDLAASALEATREASTDDDERGLRARLEQAEMRLGRFMALVGDGFDSPAVRSSIKTEEAEIRNAHAALAAAKAAKMKPPVLPALEELLERALELDELLGGEVTEARECLRRMFDGGRIRMKAQPDGFYVAESSLLPHVVLGGRRTGREPKAVAKADEGKGTESTIPAESGVLHRTDSPRATEGETRQRPRALVAFLALWGQLWGHSRRDGADHGAPCN